MAGVEMTIGTASIDVVPNLDKFKSDVESACNAISAEPVKIKIEADLKSIKTTQKTIEGLQKSAAKISNTKSVKQATNLTSGTKAYNDALTQINNLVKQYESAKQKVAGTSLESTYDDLISQLTGNNGLKSRLDGMGIDDFKKSLSDIKAKASEANVELQKMGKQTSVEEYTRNLQRVDKLIDEIRSNAAKWTQAANGSSFANYQDYIAQADALQALKEQYTSGAISAKEFQESVASVSLKAYENATAIKAAGENTLSWGDKLKGITSKFSQLFSTSEIIMKSIETGKKMVKAVVEVDTAMTELKKVTDETDESYSAFLERASGRARDVGATLSDTVTATADFARLGYDISNAETLADAATVYKNVGDGIANVSDASSSIISTMQAFGIEAEDVMSIVDRFNEVPLGCLLARRRAC